MSRLLCVIPMCRDPHCDRVHLEECDICHVEVEELFEAIDDEGNKILACESCRLSRCDHGVALTHECLDCEVEDMFERMRNLWLDISPEFGRVQ